MRRTIGTGALVLVAYAVAAVVTLRFTGHEVRPLYEGIGPAPAYRWVDPPPEFEAANVPPEPSVENVALEAQGSLPAGLTSSDGQVVLNLAAGAVPPSAGDRVFTVQFTPIDPSSLGPVPAGLEANGNAYRVDMAYGPSLRPIAALAVPGNVVVTLPRPGRSILFSPDGLQWQQLPSQVVGTHSVLGATFTGPGHFLGVATPVPELTDGGGSNDTTRIVGVAAATALLAIVLALGPLAIRRLRGSADDS